LATFAAYLVDMNNVDMNNETQESQQLPDPRPGFTVAVKAMEDLIEAVEALPPETLDRPTPCTDYAVRDLLDHIIMVMRRVAVIGEGEHWSTIEQDSIESGYTDEYRLAAERAGATWADDAKLGQLFEVPWASMPGAPLLFTYTAELATHGWDLSTATEQPFSVADEALGGALVAIKMIPAEGRDNDDMPFDPVVDPGPDAPVLLQIAGWSGRQVV
jgi:uncharacterized protein (TIGR03086 family)